MTPPRRRVRPVTREEWGHRPAPSPEARRNGSRVGAVIGYLVVAVVLAAVLIPVVWLLVRGYRWALS